MQSGVFLVLTGNQVLVLDVPAEAAADDLADDFVRDEDHKGHDEDQPAEDKDAEGDGVEEFVAVGFQCGV